ncbi:MAG: nucleotide-binding protein [Acidobacteriia bacterium]|nr:nucleotide-binding protein [Terriglobia bacterium]
MAGALVQNPGMNSNEGRASEANSQIAVSGSAPEVNVPVVAEPDVILLAEDESLTPAERAWLDSLGPDGPKLLREAGELVSRMGTILTQAAEAFQSEQLPQLEELERHAKVFNARAKDSPFPWVRDFVGGGQLVVSSMVHYGRGHRLIGAWRHERAKDEMRISSGQLEEGLKLLCEALAALPSFSDFGRIKQEMAVFTNMLRVYVPLFTATAKRADLEKQLLLGRVDAYVQGVQALAQELTAASEGILATGSEHAEVLKASGVLAGLADMLSERVDAIEELQRGRARDIYVAPVGDKIFIIHGHAEDKWRELRTLLEERLKLKDRVVVLKEEASQSKTVIEKFEEFANQCTYAVALVTPDDVVTNEEAKYGQARPNVLFEIGWFYGRFGPRRLLILKRKGTLLPSDLGGVVACEFIDAVKECAIDIEGELRAARVIA